MSVEPCEVTIDLDTSTIREWDAEIGNPHDRPLPPVLLFMAGDIHLALRQGITTWPNRETLRVTQTRLRHSHSRWPPLRVRALPQHGSTTTSRTHQRSTSEGGLTK